MQRATVYRHFPDEEAQVDACSSHWLSLNAAARPHAVDSRSPIPTSGCASRSTASTRWYERTETMVEKLYRDAPRVPAIAVRMQAPAQRSTEALAELLMRGPRAARRAAQARSAPRSVTRSASRPGARSSAIRACRDDEAVELMARLVAAA